MLAYDCVPAALGAIMNSVNVYKGWCKKCGICIAFCPQKVLAAGADGFPAPGNLEACTGCRWCELRCPDFAIVVSTEAREEGTDEE